MGSEFATTQWSVVLAARSGAGTEARVALANLCEAYWYPIYAYVRRKGYGGDAAGDLTQGFFVGLLERQSFETIDRTKGRLRSFLLASLENHLAHEGERAGARKRGGGVETVSLDTEQAEGRFRREPVEGLTPERLFERRWALAVMERAMDRLRDEVAARRGRDWFEQLKPYLSGCKPSVPHRDTASRLGMSEGAVRTAIHRLRQSYGALLREEIAHTVGDPLADVDDELRHLLNVIGSREPAG